MPVRYTSGYRDPERQAEISSDPSSITPATNSLHSAGLAVDINYRQLTPEQQEIVRSAAYMAGLQWGGLFTNPDVVHFYYDPGVNRQQLINNFTQSVRQLQAQQ